MKIIGITGGIGSGKSLVLKKLISIGYTVYNTDLRAKYLMQSNKNIINAIKYFFGPKSYLNNKINTTFLANKVFSNEKKLKILHTIIHPEIEKDFNLFKLYHKNKALIFKETAILYEQGSHKNYHFILLITSHDNIRIKRIIQYKKISKKDIFKIMDNQWKEDEKIKLSNIVIYNNNNIKNLINKLNDSLNIIKK